MVAQRASHRESGCERIYTTLLRDVTERKQIEHGALNRRHEGTGLGLPLVGSLCELHGGTFGLDSEVDVGTAATVRFPARRVA